MHKDIVGKKFGLLSVIKYCGTSDTRNTLWLCLCKCGNEKVILGKSLIHGVTRSCGCIQKETTSQKFIKNIIGKRFGRLTVLRRKFPNDNGNNVRWECKCDCGNVIIVRSGNLNNNRTKSCGCLHRDKVRKRPYYHIYALLKRRKRYAKFNPSKKTCHLTFHQFLKFVEIKTCHYCGERIQWEVYSGRYGNRHQSNLDRKDNNVGYTKKNCVVCCPRCNQMKRTLSYQEFYNFTAPIRKENIYGTH